jgi:exosome complex protein LRP1
METAELLSLVEHLEDNIDDLEESLEPLLSAALSATTKKLLFCKHHTSRYRCGIF